jgi:hypothetical protein
MATITHKIALTSEVSSNEISASELEQVAFALQEQAADGLARAWHYHATVQSFSDPHKVPVGFWPIKVQQSLDEPGAAGYHTDENGQPYSLVMYEAGDGGWPLTASHEFCEMLGDPYGNHLYRAPSPDPGAHGPRGGVHWVRILLELCDPCEDVSQGYRIGGVLVSDFITHAFGNGRTGPYDVMGHIQHARQILPNGYISWVEDDGTWKQLTNFEGEGQKVLTLGKATDRPSSQSLREWVDAHEEGATQRLARLK